MNTLFLLLSLVSAWGAEPVEAEWRKGRYSGPSYRWGCIDALFAVHDVLDAVEARAVQAGCSQRDGLRAEWEALSPLKPDPRAAAIAAMLSGEARFPGLAAAWDGGMQGVKGRWVRAQLFRQVSGQACHVYVEAFDQMLRAVGARNVSQTVFCDGGGGHVQAAFDYLRPEDDSGRRR